MDSILPLEYPIPSTHPLSPRSSAAHPTKAGHLPSTRTPLSRVDSPSLTSETASIQDACPILHLLSSDLRLRCRPGELYLGASTFHSQLCLKFFWDGNVFDGATVKEWLDEVREAAIWYLGQDIETPTEA